MNKKIPVTRISFEGPDGSGKTFHATEFFGRLDPGHREKIFFRHAPPRAANPADANADFRFERSVVRKVLRGTAWRNGVSYPSSEKILVTDRWTESAIAYGMSFEEGSTKERHMLAANYEWGEDRDLFQKNIVIVFYASDEELLRRVRNRGRAPREVKELEILLENGLVDLWYAGHISHGHPFADTILIDTETNDKRSTAAIIDDFVRSRLDTDCL